jgi:hypothetical protein
MNLIKHQSRSEIIDRIDEYYERRVIETFIELKYDNIGSNFLKPGVRFEESGVLYFLVFYLYAYDWFSIDRVTITIDGRSFRMDYANEARNVVTNGIIKELVTFYTTRDFLMRMSEARFVTIKTEGRGVTRDFDLEKKQLKKIKNLISYIDSESDIL